MTFNYYPAIKHIYPDLQLDVHYELRDDGDGEEYISSWDSEYQQPTHEELEAAWFEVQRKRKIGELREEFFSGARNEFSDSVSGDETFDLLYEMYDLIEQRNTTSTRGNALKTGFEQLQSKVKYAEGISNGDWDSLGNLTFHDAAILGWGR